MYKMKRMNYYITALLSVLFLLTGCLSEDITPNNGENEITVTIGVPTIASTRAIVHGVDDMVIDRIDVLIFNAGGAYLGRVIPAFINAGDGITHDYRFTIRVPQGNLDLVILANSAASVDAATLVVGTTTRAQANAQLTTALPANNIWNATPGSPGYRHIPMWGEISNINAATQSTVNGELIRALAKIDVTFANQAVSDRLTITGVSLFNFATTGNLAALGTQNPNTTNKQTGFANGVTFPNSVIANNEIRDQIFLFEVAPPANPANPTPADRVASTALIIRGLFDGAVSPNYSYYRIDMRDGTGPFLGVTRNHHYQIIINSVTGPGSNTAAIAYDSEAINITATVRAWDLGGTVVVHYGQYLMRTNANRFTFAQGGGTQSLNIFSDHPGGWTVENPHSSWITLGGTTSSTNTTDWQTMTIFVADGTPQQTGYFFIVTAGLRKRITVQQI